jgi:hypothetical protein
MAWTSPMTWVANAILTAAQMNTYIRDNLNYLKGVAGTVSIDSGITLATADTGLIVSSNTAGAAAITIQRTDATSPVYFRTTAFDKDLYITGARYVGIGAAPVSKLTITQQADGVTGGIRVYRSATSDYFEWLIDTANSVILYHSNLGAAAFSVDSSGNATIVGHPRVGASSRRVMKHTAATEQAMVTGSFTHSGGITGDNVAAGTGQTFGVTFTATPLVIISSATATGGTATDHVQANATSITTTGFTPQLANNSPSTTSGRMTFDWVAIGRLDS